jgi:hypothetical protein
MDRYKVLRVCKLLKNKKDKDGFIFKSKDGKVYFPDKTDKGYVDNLVLGKTYLVWVIKEEEKFGYCRCTINGVPIRDHIDSLPRTNTTRYLENFSRGTVRFSNDMYNKDIAFGVSLDSGEEYDRRFSSTETLDAIISKVGINSEAMEFAYELSVLDCYLYDLFNNKRYKES